MDNKDTAGLAKNLKVKDTLALLDRGYLAELIYFVT